MQSLDRWYADGWMFEPEKPPEYNAHYWAAKATLHEAHVREREEVILDAKYKKMGFIRVRNWVCPPEDLKVQPSFVHIQNLPIFTRMTP